MVCPFHHLLEKLLNTLLLVSNSGNFQTVDLHGAIEIILPWILAVDKQNIFLQFAGIVPTGTNLYGHWITPVFSCSCAYNYIRLDVQNTPTKNIATSSSTLSCTSTTTYHEWYRGYQEVCMHTTTSIPCNSHSQRRSLELTQSWYSPTSISRMRLYLRRTGTLSVLID